MCGISGIWFFKQDEQDESSIRTMNNALKHRGPDGEGYYTEKSVGLYLGHRRLSIIDLSDSAKQPMPSRDGNMVISYNGEIYNFPELKQQLLSEGASFNTHSDTEVILAAWQQWGISSLNQLNGMWAFGLWNTHEQSLTLSRDRFGVKPLYYVYSPGRFFAFASETSAFSDLSFFRREINKHHIAISLEDLYYCEANGETLYQNIKQVRPGHNLTVTSKGISSRKWWRASSHIKSNTENYPDQVGTFKEIFTDACALRLRSDVTIATALSGGIDSSSVFCTIKRFAKENTPLKYLPQNWQQAVVATFPGTVMDERRYAEEVIRETNGDVLFVEASSNDLADDIFHETINGGFIYDTPPVVHHIYRKMNEAGIKVSIDGHGADELLFGYPADVLSAFRGAFSPFRKRGYLKTYRAMIDGLQQPSLLNRATRKILPFFADDDLLLVKPYYNKNYEEDFNCRNLTPAENISYRSFHIVLPTLLRNWDRASMRHAVEVRMPFMDWRLVTFLLSLPVSSKIKDGYTKIILRDAMKGIVPETVLQRKTKIGVQAPVKEWFAGPLRTFIMDIVSSDSFQQSDIWDGSRVKKKIEKQGVQKPWDEKLCKQLWPLINAQLLMQYV